MQTTNYNEIKRKIGRTPKIENKYHLTINKIENLKIVKKDQLKKYCWRNNIIKAWCYSKGIGKGYFSNSLSSIWIGFYDEPNFDDREENNASKFIEVNCSCKEDMCNYIFNEFYISDQIEDEYDLQSQETILEFVNQLLDENILAM